LNTHYTQIGVAANNIVFNGEETWLAVQIFGRPAADCPAPDPAIRSSITVANVQLANMGNELSADQASIDAMMPSNASRNAAVTSYDKLAAAYNTLLTETKANIVTYNAAVGIYNTCIGG
jgi:hypothetical protein